MTNRRHGWWGPISALAVLGVGIWQGWGCLLLSGVIGAIFAFGYYNDGEFVGFFLTALFLVPGVVVVVQSIRTETSPSGDGWAAIALAALAAVCLPSTISEFREWGKARREKRIEAVLRNKQEYDQSWMGATGETEGEYRARMAREWASFWANAAGERHGTGESEKAFQARKEASWIAYWHESNQRVAASKSSH